MGRGHYKQAVNATASAVEEHTQLKLDREDLSGSNLFTQAFKVDQVGTKPTVPGCDFRTLTN